MSLRRRVPRRCGGPGTNSAARWCPSRVRRVHRAVKIHNTKRHLEGRRGVRLHLVGRPCRTSQQLLVLFTVLGLPSPSSWLSRVGNRERCGEVDRAASAEATRSAPCRCAVRAQAVTTRTGAPADSFALVFPESRKILRRAPCAKLLLGGYYENPCVQKCIGERLRVYLRKLLRFDLCAIRACVYFSAYRASVLPDA